MTLPLILAWASGATLGAIVSRLAQSGLDIGGGSLDAALRGPCNRLDVDMSGLLRSGEVAAKVTPETYIELKPGSAS